ncbi:MAG: alpha-L-rhamnosidase C-terminal domain-containing protein [Bacteroidota bacterium]
MNCNNLKISFLNLFFIFWCLLLTGQNVQDTVAGTSVFEQLPPVFGPEYDEITQKDELTRVFISPVKVMWTSDDTGELVKNTEVLLQPGNSQSDMSPITEFCSMKTTESDTSSILLDYGKELHGGLQLVMGGSSRREPSLVRIRFGESVGEANSDTYNSDWLMGFSTDDHAKRDIVMEIPRSGLIEIGNTGFRFVRIDLLQPNTTINLKEARAILRYRDIPYIGSFISSNPRLDSIWLTGAYTTHLNMQEFLWDGIKRDRLVWLGDFHPELKTINSVFGYNEVVPNSLDLACEQYPLPQWMNGMSSYSMWYLIIHHDWYMQNGDLGYLKKHRDYIVGLIDLIDSKIADDGTETLSPFRFLDWPSTPNTEGVEAGYRALLVWALNDAQKLCEVLDEPESAATCVSAIGNLNRKIKGHNDLKQAAALMARAGIMKPEKASNEVVAVDGAKRFSTFYGLYMLDALAMAGMHDQALQIISDYWGGMLDMGATTFWEDFNIEWMENSARLDEFTPEGMNDIHGDFGDYCYPSYRHSFCHGWASGPTSWLTENVLGITIAEPGCKTLKIEPHLGDLQWAAGTFPTPYGVVKVKHTKLENGEIESEIEAPEEIKILKRNL